MAHGSVRGKAKSPAARGRVKSFADALRPYFTSGAVARGQSYAQRGAVGEIEGTHDGATAIVRGGSRYRVGVRWFDQPDWFAVTAHCTCPAFPRYGACKHLWALLEVLGEERVTPKVDPRVDFLYEPFDRELDLDVPALTWLEELADIIGAQPDDDVLDFGAAAPSAAPALASVDDLEIELGAAPPAHRDPWTELAGTEREIRYVVDARSADHGDELALDVILLRRRRNGQWDDGRRLALHDSPPPEVDDPADLAIHGLLIGARRDDWGHWYGSGSTGRFRVGATLEATLLPVLARTGRLWVAAHGGDTATAFGPYALDEAGPWRFAPTLDTAAEGGALQVGAVLVRSADELAIEEADLVTGGGHVFAQGRVGRLEPVDSAEFARTLRRRQLGLLPAEARGAVLDLLSRVPGFDPARIEGAAVAPPVESQPCLHVEAPSEDAHHSRQLECRVEFDYDGSLVAADVAGAFIVDADAAALMPRNLDDERGRLEELIAAGARLRPGRDGSPGGCTVAVGQLQALALALLDRGWRVTASGREWRRAGATSVSVASGIDWFELAGGVDFGAGGTVALPALLAAARSGERTVVLGDGSLGVLPERWLESWGLLGLGGEADDETLRFARSQGWLLDALLADRENVRVDADFARLRERLADFRGVAPKTEPRGFRGTLRPYQREAVGWFAFLRDLALGGCLADDMGLGKTVQVLALLESRRVGRRRRGGVDAPSLVVAPRSVVFNWIAEAARFAPRLRVLDYTGTDRRARAAAADDADLWVTTYGTLRRDAPELAERRFDYVVLDEAQAIKNPHSQSAKAARLLVAEHRLALSGTPIENHLGELWSLFEFLNPGMLGRLRSFKDFARRTQPSEDGEDLGRLSRAIAPFFLRRTKAEVLADLPEKTEQVLPCQLTGAERRSYDELRNYYRVALSEKADEAGMEGIGIQVLEALLRLRQAACHPGLIDRARRDESSAKLEVLLGVIENVVAEGNKALVFSQFTSLLGIVRAKLRERGIAHEYLDGRTRKREEKVERFQTDDACPLFLISIKAGGSGLNLTAADYVFLLDPWWNPAVEAQAIDRVHRIGRTKPVVAYRLIARDTVEEKVVELQERKRALADAVLGQNRVGLRDLTREDLQHLLS